MVIFYFPLFYFLSPKSWFVTVYLEHFLNTARVGLYDIQQLMISNNLYEHFVKSHIVLNTARVGLYPHNPPHEGAQA